MALTIKEKLGAVAAFIPFVSTVSGLIKAVIYYRGSRPENRKEMDKTAAVAHKTALDKLAQVEEKYNNKLWKASLFEMIPGVNLIAASYSAYLLHGLSEERDEVLSPKKDIEKTFKQFKIEPLNDDAKNELMFNVIRSLDEKDEQKGSIIHFSHGVIAGLNDISKVTADQVINAATQSLAELPQETKPERSKEEIIRAIEEKNQSQKPSEMKFD